MHESERRGAFFTRNKLKIVLAVTLSGAAAVAGPRAYNAARDFISPESQIVGGVPGQVETHTWVRRCNAALKCATSYYDPYLGIEQCPQDIEAAKKGKQIQSFNPIIGEIYQGCNYDYVRVNTDTWQKLPDGSTIVFEGSPSKRLRK